MRRRKSILKNKTIFIFLTLATLSSVIYLLLKESTPKQQMVLSSDKKIEVVYPTQYSDKHITKNAITVDAKFKDLVMFDEKNARDDLLANVISSVKTNEQKSKGLEQGTWLWTPLLDITPKYRSLIISEAKAKGVLNIYLSIDSYLDIYVMADGQSKDRKKALFSKALEDFIKEAAKNNITVDAEAGWRNWAEKGNSYKAFAVLDYAIKFNKTHNYKLRGFQYDVEPYLLESYQKDKAFVLSNFLNLINNSVTMLDKSDLELSVVIPEFYDGTNNTTPNFSFGGKLGYTIDHLINILNRRPDSKIIVMSYRNFSLGDDGSIAISKDEISKANKSDTKIIIAQETGDVKPPYVTFYDTSLLYYQRQVKTLQKNFAGEKSYAGIATHYINALMELR